MPEDTTDKARARSGRTSSANLESVLLAAAERVLADAGLEGITVRAVAAEASVAPMGVYNRFANKAGLVAALMARAFDDLGAAIAAHDVDPITRLRTSSAGYRDFALAHPERYRMMFFGGFVPTQSPLDLRTHGRAAFAVLVDAISYAIEHDSIGPRDARLAAQQLWSAMHGAIALELADLGFVDSHQTVYAGLIDVILTGMQIPAHH
jgi:AcrR family transcriptional regulator